MKPAFNRIEPNPSHLDQVKSPPPVGQKRAFSFEIRRTPQQLSVATETANDLGTQNQNLNPDPASNLTQFDHQNDSSDRQLTNPTLEINQATATPLDITACEAQLQQIVEQIEQLYVEGPIVAGWLESFTSTADVIHQDLVEVPTEQLDISVPSAPVVNASPHASYHLCGLDTTGQKWCYPCPLDQLPSVSIAIARYQKLQQILERKQYLETRLKELIKAAG